MTILRSWQLRVHKTK